MDTVSYYTILNSDSNSYGTSLRNVCGKSLVIKILTNLEKSMAFTKFFLSKTFFVKVVIVRIFSCANITQVMKMVFLS